jgi:hypothetical protein
MKNLYHSLLLLIAGSTQKELASQIRYLPVHNPFHNHSLFCDSRKSNLHRDLQS